MLDTDEVILSLASLLHDIGKVIQRTDKKGKHESLSAEFVKTHLPDKTSAEDVAKLVEKHHQGGDDPLLQLLIEADHTSAGEREIETKEETGQTYYPLHRPLKSPIADPDETVYYPVQRLNIQDYEQLVPSNKAKAGTTEYNDIVDELINGMSSIGKLYQAANWLPYITSLSELLRRELFFVPSAPAVEKEPRNSLYEHSRLTAALAICFKRSGSKSFTIIVGDVGGIQRFVYGQRVYKQALKSLKGRSAYISFLADAVAKHILIKHRLPPFNLIYSAGGHFMIISPKLDTDAKKGLVKEINQFLLKRHKGSLRLYLGFSDIELGKEQSPETGQQGLWKIIKQKIEEAHEDLKKRKETPFKELLTEHYETLFKERIEQENQVCESCGIYIQDNREVRRIGEGEEALNVCPLCYGLAELGRRLVTSRYIVEMWGSITIKEKDDWEKTLNFTADDLSISYYLAENEQDLKQLLQLLSINPRGLWMVLVKTLNDSNFTDTINTTREFIDKLPIAVGFTFMPQWAPLAEDRQIKSFDQLALASEGSHEIGYLRLDLDGMGSLIRDKADRFSVLSTISQLISFVMEGVVEQLVRNSSSQITGRSFKNLYLIYSGGDDLLLVGPWNEVVEFADVLKTKISAFFKTRKPTMTCALLVEDPKTPVKVATETLDRLIADAKKRKDCVSCGGEVMGWNFFTETLRVAHLLSEDINAGAVSRALIFKLATLFTEYTQDKYWSVVRHRLKYVLSRHMSKKEERRVSQEIDQLEKTYLQELTTLFPMMKALTWLSEKYTREEVAA